MTKPLTDVTVNTSHKHFVSTSSAGCGIFFNDLTNKLSTSDRQLCQLTVDLMNHKHASICFIN